jgi:hypothetical protein
VVHEEFPRKHHGRIPEALSARLEGERFLPHGSQLWEMAASFVTAGVLHQELFTQNSRELLFVWERVRDVAPALRESFKNSNIARNLEIVANSMIADRLPDSAFGV